MPFNILNTDRFGLPCYRRSFLSRGVIIISLIPSSEENAYLANKCAFLYSYKIKKHQVRRIGAF